MAGGHSRRAGLAGDGEQRKETQISEGSQIRDDCRLRDKHMLGGEHTDPVRSFINVTKVATLFNDEV